VAIPVLNGARYLDEVLGAVRAQRLDSEVEIVVVDSGSTDGSVEIARRHGALVHEIPREEFSHGGTRNLLMELASGEHVAFLTQDATPADEGWLAALLQGFEAAPDVAAVFGPHEARPGASHMIASEMERHFATWGEGRELQVQRLERTPEGIGAYRAFPGLLTFLSDVNCALARWAWQRVPYREVPYAEDQLLGRELIEAGFAKAFSPRARVLHSHDYPPVAFFRRYFDEFRSLREVLGFRQPWGLRQTPRDVRGMVAADARWLRAHRVRGPALARALAVSARHHALRQAASILGTRAERLPPPLRKRLSLEGRPTFEPYEAPASPLLSDGGEAWFNPRWGWEFVRRSYPRRRVLLEAGSGEPGASLRLAWFVSPWHVGSGGHTTIFRLVREMERRGHRCEIYLFDPFQRERRPDEELREEVRSRFVPVDAPVFNGLSSFRSADVAIATQWWTAFAVRDLPGCREKVYLVQDDEAQFHATSSESLWVDETFHMGFRYIAYTEWLAELLREREGVEARHFDCGSDTDTYTFAGDEGREPGLVAVYGRKETGRRAVDLALMGLATLAERRPGVRTVLFGSREKLETPTPAENLGPRPPAELAALYRRASVGVVFSLTTHSLVAQEMMASGLPVVELDGENVSSALGDSGDVAVLVEPAPDAIATGIERLLDDREAAAAMARRARGWVEGRTWERAGEQVEDALRQFLSSPRSSEAVVG
jgi:glycosyltransferase involved in cell wall biosynthesis/GT2 family glycosyltransferase